MSKTHRSYTLQFKQEALVKAAALGSQKAAAQELGLNSQNISRCCGFRIDALIKAVNAMQALPHA